MKQKIKYESIEIRFSKIETSCPSNYVPSKLFMYDTSLKKLCGKNEENGNINYLNMNSKVKHINTLLMSLNCMKFDYRQ